MVIDTVIIRGLSITTPNVVRNHISLYQGEEYAALDVKNSIKKLYETGLFRAVDIYKLNETDSTISLSISLEEFPYCEEIEYKGLKKVKQKDQYYKQ